MGNKTGGLLLRSVTRRFPGVTALAGVDFTARPGEVHALVGGNGAGKSTLMSIASGALAQDEGIVEIGGKPLSKISPTAAREQGLSIAFQHPAMLPDLTVAENLALSVPIDMRPELSRARLWTREWLEPMGMEIDPTVPVGRLSLAEKQAVEICGALASDPQVLVLDEPTEPFMTAEIDRLFEQIHRLAREGVAVVYISHRLPDVFALADRITVLRDGEVRGTFVAGEADENAIVTLIAGRSIETLFPPVAEDPGPTFMTISDLSAEGLRGVSTDVRRHEVVGLAGVEGNGQREFIRALGGAAGSTGTVTIEGKTVNLSGPRQVRQSGVVLMPQERHTEGVSPVLSVRANLGVAATSRTTTGGVVKPAAERELVAAQIEGLGIKTASPDTAVENLSGGNQQKVVLGRSLLAEPRVLLCDEPTQGIDVGVRSDIYHRLRDSAEHGAPVVVLSSDNVELAGLCDRVLIFSRGRIVAELGGAELTEHAITEASLTATDDRASAVTEADPASVAEPESHTERPRRRTSSWRRFLSGEQAPSSFLLIAIVALGLISTFGTERFLTAFNVGSMLGLLAPVLFLAAGQLIVMLTGGIDLSVGPLSGALVVVASFFIVEGYGVGWWILGLVLMFVLAGLVGLANGAMVRYAKVTPVVATLVTFTALQGLSLVLRDAPGGIIALDVVNVLNTRIGSVPVAVIIGAVLLLVLERFSRRSTAGLSLRGAGSAPQAARNRGIPVGRAQLLAYVACSGLTVLGALMLMAQIGVGDPSAGTTYTLTSITAVVLGGASIFGGRGSFIGVLCGVMLLQLIDNTTIFLGLSQAWQYWLVGIIALVATAVYSQVQRKAVG